jgi:hypothetical protein
MTKKMRTFLFLILSAFFVLGAISAVFYAQGYRFDFKNLKFLKTGGIFVKVSPSNANVIIDQKLIGRTQPINDYLFTQSLLPKEYSVRIEKEGYSSWSKNLEVKETEVAEAKNIILFPQKVSFTEAKSNIENFYPLDGEKIILQKSAGSSQAETLSIYDLGRDKETELEKLNIFLAGYELLELKTLDSQSLLLYLKNKKTRKENYFFVDLRINDPLAQKTDFLSKKTGNISLASSFGEEFFFWQEGTSIFKKSPASSDLPVQFLEDKIETFILANGYFYLLTQEGKTLKIDQNKNFPTQEMAEGQFDFKEKSTYELIFFEGKLFLKEDESLYALNEKNKNFEKIFDGVKSIKISPFGDKLLCQMQNEIEVYLLKDIDVPFQEKAGSKIFISRFSQPVQGLDWIENDYFAFANAGQITLSETDIRSNLNTYNIGQLPDPKIWFCQKNKKLYALSNNSLFSSDKLLQTGLGF